MIPSRGSNSTRPGTLLSPSAAIHHHHIRASSRPTDRPPSRFNPLYLRLAIASICCQPPIQYKYPFFHFCFWMCVRARLCAWRNSSVFDERVAFRNLISFLVQTIFRSLFVPHANLPALFPLMRVIDLTFGENKKEKKRKHNWNDNVEITSFFIYY